MGTLLFFFLLLSKTAAKEHEISPKDGPFFDAGVSAPEIFGVNYGRVSNNLPPPSEAIALVSALGIRSVKLFDADPAVMRSLAGTSLRLCVGVPDSDIPKLAASPVAAWAWATTNVLPFAAQVDAVVVGDEVLRRGPCSALLLPAMRNLHAALAWVRIEDRIKVSTPHSMSILANTSFPPSRAVFKSHHRRTLRGVLRFLASTGSFLMINAYPFFAYTQNRGRDVPLAYALGSKGADFVVDGGNGLRYSSLLDAQLDAVRAAMAKLGAFGGVPIVVGQTGWPSEGGFGATRANAAAYYRYIVRRTAAAAGTPLKPLSPVPIYWFALFNENLKRSCLERSFGIFYPNMSCVYGPL